MVKKIKTDTNIRTMTDLEIKCEIDRQITLLVRVNLLMVLLVVFSFILIWDSFEIAKLDNADVGSALMFIIGILVLAVALFLFASMLMYNSKYR